MDVFVSLRGFPAGRLPDAVRRWDDLGVRGVVQGDHIFPMNAPYRSPEAHAGGESLTLLTVAAALSPRLAVASVTVNVGFQHPLFAIRRFAQLAMLFGGERVYAGFGAGWARREFAAIGIKMPPHSERLDRLAEVLQLARALYHDGYADLEGAHVVARELPLAPMPPVPPRILVGGGSERLLQLAARYADHLDLNAPSHRASKVEPQRKLMTTVADLETMSAYVSDQAKAAGRDAGAVTTSVVVTDVVFCPEEQITAEAAAICARAEMAPIDLTHSPFVLLGEPQRMADAINERRERIGIDWIALPHTAVERYFSDVAPLVDRRS